MSSREVLTFQFGNYSNYVGAHWWNIQESYFQYDDRNPSDINHDVLFREGKTLKGHTTFTPRLILVDKAENLVNVPTISESPTKSESLASNEYKMISVQEQNIPEKHEFVKDLEKLDKGQRVDFSSKDYNFSETVRTWCDYLRTRYHPKSIATFHNSLQTDLFHSGVDIYSCIESDFVERVRSYMEECDNLQGFQVVVDATDGFGGLTDSALTHLREEYSSKSIFTVPVICSHSESNTPLDDIKRTINIMLTYQKLSEHSCLVVPLGTTTSAWRSLGPPVDFPNLMYNPENSYETSAVLASYLDTVTLKYRLREDYNHIYDMVSGLNYYNKKICAASLSLPFPIAPNSYLLDTLENLDDSLPLWSQMTPGCEISDDTILYQRITVRGIPLSRLRNPSVVRQNSRAHACTSVEELVHLYLSFRLETISDVASAKVPLKTVLPFPRIFSPHVSPLGSVDETSTRMDNYSVASCPVITGVHCCKGVGRMLDSLHKCVKSVNIKRFHHFLGAHMDVDEFNECLDKVLAMGYGYASDVELR
ncbi:hypothetical protein RUM43_005055 [Polyplax serrata]|uniref:Protein misato n=1 Tax=Polyplax serrata TaxID=468196 RepID=A0AAN8SBK6_POLSC